MDHLKLINAQQTKAKHACKDAEEKLESVPPFGLKICAGLTT